MKKLLLLFTAFILLSAISCREEKKKAADPLEKAAWLIGTWENDSRAGKLSETWSRSANGFKGMGAFTAGSDTIFSEKLGLIEEDGDLYYVATVKDQNNGEAVTFPLLNATADQLVFENKEHDFPQKIVYTHYGDSLIAIISGMKDGQLKTENFRMRKAAK